MFLVLRWVGNTAKTKLLLFDCYIFVVRLLASKRALKLIIKKYLKYLHFLP